MSVGHVESIIQYSLRMFDIFGGLSVPNESYMYSIYVILNKLSLQNIYLETKCLYVGT